MSGTPPSERTVAKATEARVQREQGTSLERQSGEGVAKVAEVTKTVSALEAELKSDSVFSVTCTFRSCMNVTLKCVLL